MTVRRMKAYSGEQGYVYQYYFVGKRAALPGQSRGPATEYVFDATSDRKTMFSVSVFLTEDAVKQWGSVHGRPLTGAEEYAAVKMRLFRAFDEIEDMKGQGRSLLLDSRDLEELLSTLGVA